MYFDDLKWLVETYETVAGVSLPRSVQYLHYMQHCAEQNLEPVNAASFGKLIRSVFLGLRTRRLGTLGAIQNIIITEFELKPIRWFDYS